MALRVNVKERGDRTYIIECAGSIDATTHTILGSEVDQILAKSPNRIIFDMKNVGYISSAGISVILKTEQSLATQGGSALMVHLQPQIRKVFDIVQALPNQQIFASVEELDHYLKEIQRKVKEGEIE
jgi:anti-sigma B factor antagonist